MITAIITLSPDDTTLGALRRLVDDADRYALPGGTTLLDGGHVGLTDDPARTVGRHGNDVAAVRAFLEDTATLPADTELAFGTDLAVDLPVLAVENISSGEHHDAVPENVLVVVNANCRSHDA